MPPREGVYGFLAEFNTPSDLVYATEKAVRRGLPPDGVLHALSGGRGGRSAALPHDAGSTDLPAGRAGWTDDGIPDADLDQRVGLSAEYCRAASVQLAGLHYPGIRVDNSVCGSFRGVRDAGAVWSAADSTIPVFNAPNFRNGATTDKFFLCIEAFDPKFSLGDTRTFLEQFPAVSVVEVEH